MKRSSSMPSSCFLRAWYEYIEKQAAAMDSLSPLVMVAAKSSLSVLFTLSRISGIFM